MEKTFLLYLSAHWGDLMEQIKKICHIHFKLEEKQAALREQAALVLPLHREHVRLEQNLH